MYDYSFLFFNNTFIFIHLQITTFLGKKHFKHEKHIETHIKGK